MGATKKKTITFSNEYIENMTTELAIDILKDRIECYKCSECLCDNKKHSKYSCTETANLALAYIEGARLAVNDKPDNEPETESADGLFASTRKFMRDHGYRRCYMCGSDLTGGGSNNA